MRPTPTKTCKQLRPPFVSTSRLTLLPGSLLIPNPSRWTTLPRWTCKQPRPLLRVRKSCRLTVSFAPSIPALDQNQSSAALSPAQDNNVLHANIEEARGLLPLSSQSSPYEAFASANAGFFSIPPWAERGVGLVVQAYLNSTGLVITVADAPAANQNPGPAPADGPNDASVEHQNAVVEPPAANQNQNPDPAPLEQQNAIVEPPAANEDDLPLPLVPPAPPCYRDEEGRWRCSRCPTKRSRRDELRRHLRFIHYAEYYDDVPTQEGYRRAQMDCP